MSRGAPRPERRPGRARREPVPANPLSYGFGDDDEWDEGPDGSAGVREPRRPKPVGPMSGAGEKPAPEVELSLVLAVTEPPVGACVA